MSWKLVFTPQAEDDARWLRAVGLHERAEQLLELLRQDPYAAPPAYWRLRGDLEGAYARRINFQHRLIYQVLPEARTVKVCRLWTAPAAATAMTTTLAPETTAMTHSTLFFEPSIARHPRFPTLNAAYLADESEVVAHLLKEATLPAATRDRIAERARALVVEVRRQRVKGSGIDAFMHEYELSSQEGVVLMCLAEALLRIPDAETRDKLIEDKIGSADWEKHLGKSESLFVNASTWGLMLTGRMIKLKDSEGVFKRLVQRSGEPVIRQAITQAMRILGRQFVMGRTIKEALERARSAEKVGYRHSYDMLGEAARTAKDAERYFQAYQQAIDAIGKEAAGRGPIAAPGISVKLSALHPRYELAQGERVMRELVPKLKALALAAKRYDIGMTVDAEEAERLDISLAVLEAVFKDPELAGWEGFGLALQAYQKRAFHVLDWLADLARSQGRRLMVRLVKGAYWDSEIKRAQERGLPGYPVFTRKASTDVSYLACARKLLANRDAFYPQFATHNAHTVAAVLEMAGDNREFEFQRLHGMGEALYEQIVGADRLGVPCRVYAPVGSHEDLLAYLVRRLLENGANTSFVNRIVDEKAPIDEIIADPVTKVARLARIPHPHIPLPRDLYGEARQNSAGLDLSNIDNLRRLEAEMAQALQRDWRAAPIIGGVMKDGEGK
ncbi:MAG TPA: bifunctional proline dehydrogenase/L-glutamate gamma-semialdehyde dehydrogenase PutA, partial [Candidatus Competibacteraceae bacterium]|nr:bifunctional proline dehydrogenase/L-glutamate gamma-semialdehyde dehydrogenase PutA [Candidatus Competibacteraceae bacterium]